MPFGTLLNIVPKLAKKLKQLQPNYFTEFVKEIHILFPLSNILLHSEAFPPYNKQHTKQICMMSSKISYLCSFYKLFQDIRIPRHFYTLTKGIIVLAITHFSWLHSKRPAVFSQPKQTIKPPLKLTLQKTSVTITSV